ncbi:MAG: hypothetical protein GY794_08845 [bacterium]|nr:hypothetical protein [bacterium]
MPSVHNPQNVSIGSTDLSDVVSIEWNEHRQEIVSPPGDDEIYQCRAGYANASLRGRLSFTDPALAAVAAGQFGTLTATLKGIGGRSDQTLTITSVQSAGASNLAGHNRGASCYVPFLAVSSDGITGPVTLT